MTVYCPFCGAAVEVTPRTTHIRINSRGNLLISFDDVVVVHACPQPQDA